MPKIYKRICDNCNNYYEGVGKMFCSPKCRAHGERDKMSLWGSVGRAARWRKSERGSYVTCLVCSRKRWEYPYKLKEQTNNFCSRKCANIFNAEKLSIDRVGDGNPMYGKIPWNYTGKGGPDSFYSMRSWKKLSAKVRERYNYECQNCGDEGIIVHHIKPRMSGGTDDRGNLTLLCRSCHSKLHRLLEREVVSNEHIVR